jgi:hypothetical protein
MALIFYKTAKSEKAKNKEAISIPPGAFVKIKM